MKKCHMKSVRIIMGCLTVCVLLSACASSRSSRPSKEDYDDRVTENFIRTNFFKTNYFKDIHQRHLMVPFTVNNSNLLLGKDLEVRPGPAPFHPGGDTRVTYRDSKKVEIGHYYMKDPRKMRSCDRTACDKDRPNSVDIDGEVELFFPLKTDPTSVEFVFPDESFQVFEVKEDVKEALARNPVNTTQ